MTMLDMNEGPDGTWSARGERRRHAFNDPGSTVGTIRYFNWAVFRKIFWIFLVLGILIAVIAAINVYFGPWWNTFFFLLLTAITVANLWSPIPVLAAALGGFLYAALSDTDLSQGIRNGIITLLDKITVTALIFLQVVVGFLATWPLAENPGAIMYVLCGAILVALVFHKFSLGDGRWFAWSVVIYAAIVVMIALWTTIPESARGWIPGYSYLSGVEEPKVAQPVQIPTYKDGDTLPLTRGDPDGTTVWLTGEINIPNHTFGDCVTRSPMNEVGMDGNESRTTIWAWPMKDEPVLVTFYLRVPGQVNASGQVVCPPLRD